jgi:beta-lactamase class A
MRTISFILIFVLLFSICAFTMAAADQKYPVLHDRSDPLFEQALEGALRAEFGLEFWKTIEAKKAGIVVVDITDLQQPMVAGINANEMMYAASLPKIAILLGAFVQIENGKMVLDETTRTDLTRMIRNSSNKAATDMLQRVGIANLAEILQSDRLRLYDPKYNGGLWVGRDYSGGSNWKRDPLHNISHGATAMQVARFYYLLATDQLVSADLGKEMKEMLSKPAIQHKFVKGLKNRPRADVYRKSGTWKRFHADSGVIVREQHTYIIVAIAEHPQGAEGLSQLVVTVDDMMERIRPSSP